MVSPIVRINTFFCTSQERFVDPMSKIYIGLGGILGLNRFPIILNRAKYAITSAVAVYAVLVTAGLMYLTEINVRFKNKAVVINDIEHVFCVIFSLITWKRLQRYYHKLDTFDVEIGRRPNITKQSLQNFVVMAMFTICFTSYYCLTYLCGSFERVDLDAHLIPVYLIHFLELFYYGHLLSLMVPRLRLINCFVAIELSDRKSIVWPRTTDIGSFKININNIEMTRLTDLYQILIKAYDLLMEALKWQLVVVIITTFMSTLGFCYITALVIIEKENPLTDIIWVVSMMAGQMLPLFSLCTFCDRVHGEVRCLRELLASRLYENKLDKHGRGAARALIALTEARDLSFSLMQCIRVDVSLPFKFIGLLVTYLIIMLQFQKVTRPPTVA